MILTLKILPEMVTLDMDGYGSLFTVMLLDIINEPIYLFTL